MNEAFLEVLHRQYFEQISNCVLECTHFHKSKHTKFIDYTGLMEKLHVVFESARIDGINETQFREWVNEALPIDHAPIQYNYKDKKAA